MHPSLSRRAFRELVIFLGFLGGAAVFTFPLVLDMTKAVTDVADPLLDAWAFGWVAHQLVRDPLHLFDSNRYYPETGTLAFTDPMLGMTVPLAPLQWLVENPVLTFNVAMLLSIAFSGYGAYRLARYLSGSALAGGVAGSIFAFNPYRLSHLAHVNLQAAGFIPLSFLCLTRFLHEGRVRHAVGLALFLWLVSASCAYYGVFMWTALGIAVPYELWRTRAIQKPRRMIGLGLALGLSALAYLPLAWPLVRLDREFGMRRPLERLQRFSARPHDYLRSGANLHEAAGLEPPAMGRNLFPGFAALGLGLLALARPTRIKGLYLLVGAFAAWASLGPAYGLYRVLHALVPGISGLRAPPRFAILVLLSLAVVSGFAASWLVRRLDFPARHLVAGLLVIFPLVESNGVPVPYTRAPDIPEVYDWLASQPGPTPVVEVPFDWALRNNAIYLYWSTAHFKPLANGYSTLVPPVFTDLRVAMTHFPDRTSMDALRRLGFRYVILHRDLYLRRRAEAMERAMNAEEELRIVHRTAQETVYMILNP